MQINGLVNFLDKIYIDYKEIENQIRLYDLVFYKTRINEIEYGMKLPMFNTSFYSYILKTNKIPTQEEYWFNYMYEEHEFYDKLLSDEQMLGLKARVYRSYPSLVRDIHFAKTLKEISMFDDVYYNTELDTKYGIDIVVLKDNKLLGINLFTNTENSINARLKKKYRTKNSINFNCIDVPIDFKGSKICGSFFLYSEREIEKIIKCLNTEREI